MEEVCFLLAVNVSASMTAIIAITTHSEPVIKTAL